MTKNHANKAKTLYRHHAQPHADAKNVSNTTVYLGISSCVYLIIANATSANILL